MHTTNRVVVWGRSFAFSVRRVWDVAQIVPRERLSPDETFGAITLGLKFFLYAFLLLIILLCATTSTSNVLLLEAAMAKV